MEFIECVWIVGIVDVGVFFDCIVVGEVFECGCYVYVVYVVYIGMGEGCDYVWIGVEGVVVDGQVVLV